MFIAFDGTDGAGKTTLCKYVVTELKQKYDNVVLYDMGKLGFIDEVLLSIKYGETACSAEIRELLYYFEGNLFGNNIVSNALGRKQPIIIIDRYILSYFSYGPLNGVPIELINKLTNTMPWPDLYFYIDITPELAEKRISVYRKIDKPEIGFKNQLDTSNESINQLKFITHQSKVRENFHNAIKLFNKPVHIIDSKDEKQYKAEKIMYEINKYLAEL